MESCVIVFEIALRERMDDLSRLQIKQIAELVRAIMHDESFHRAHFSKTTYCFLFRTQS